MGIPDSRRARLARRFALDRNKLRRTSDRIEGWAKLLLVGLYIPLAVLAIVLVTSALRSQGAGELRAAQSLRQVQAVVTAATPPAGAPARPPNFGLAPARWTVDGVTHTGKVPAPPDVTAGVKVPVWIDHSGTPRQPPVTATQIASREVLASIATPVVLIGLLWLAWRGLRWPLDRHRLAGWDRAWSLAEHQWKR